MKYHKYLIHTEKTGAFIDIPVGTSSDEYGRIQTLFEKRHSKGKFDYVSMVPMSEDNVVAGVLYNWGLAGSDGAWFIVYQFPQDSDAAVRAAEDKLRRDRDVVRLKHHKLKLVTFKI
jgi:hypothetical protein